MSALDGNAVNFHHLPLCSESRLASFIDRGAFETTSATKSGSSSPTARIGGVGRCPAIG
jgi:hypothetical protein